MSDFGYYPRVTRFGEDDATGSSAYKTQVNASGSTNTKGSWTQIAASCPFDSQGIMLTFLGSTGDRSCLLDIGVGGAGSEKVVVPNLAVMGNNSYQTLRYAYLPAYIPAAARVAARVQSSVANADVYIKMQFVAANGAVPLQVATNYGADTSTSKGVNTISGGSANTEGSWTQITASCSEMKYALLMMENNGASSQDTALDLGIGGAGSEQIVVSNIYGAGVTGNVQHVPGWFAFPLNIPAGTRIAARARSTSSGSGGYISLIGWN